MRVSAAGRTDTGVHASLQIVHFDTVKDRTPGTWVRAANDKLPATMRMLWACPVAEDFHARHSARRRFYQYAVLNRSAPSALLRDFTAHCPQTLNMDKMQVGAEYLCGRHDFSAFRASSCQAKTPVRNVEHIDIVRKGDWVILNFCADGFLHRMVRNIVGALLPVGLGEQQPEWILQLLNGKDRTLSPPPAPPQGLYFAGAEYSQEIVLPETRRELTVSLRYLD